MASSLTLDQHKGQSCLYSSQAENILTTRWHFSSNDVCKLMCERKGRVHGSRQVLFPRNDALAVGLGDQSSSEYQRNKTFIP